MGLPNSLWFSVIGVHIIGANVLHGQNGCVSVGTSALDRGFDAIDLASGGILAIGYTEGVGSGLRDGYFAKINSDGTFGWGKSFGGGNHEELYDIVLWGSHYALLGYTRSYGAGSADALVLIIDDAGTILGSYTYGGSGSEQAKAGIVTPSGNLVATGFSYSYSSGGADMYVFKIDNTGSLLWGVGIGGSSDERGRGIINVGDTGYVAIGYTNSAGAGGYDFYIVSLDVNGNVKWTRAIGGPSNDFGQDIISIGDTLLIAVGYTSSFGNGGEDVYVVALDERGNLRWSEAIGGSGNERAWSISATADGNIVIVGQTNSFGAGGVDGYVIKMDLYGNIMWTRTVGGTGNDYFRSGKESSSGELVLAGWTSSFSLGGDDIFIVKLDANGNLSSGCTSCIIRSGGTAVSVISVIGEFGSVSSGGVQGTGSNSTNAGGSLLVTCVLNNVSVVLNGMKQGENVELKWHVEGSDLIQKFIIEGSNDGTHFEFIDEIDNHYSAKQAYSFEVPDYWRFYRVKAITIDYADGVYSNIWAKSQSTQSDIAIQTTQVVHNNLVIEISSKRDRTCNIELITVDGKIIKREVVALRKGINRIVINNVNNVNNQSLLLLRIGEHKAIVQVF
ncbi:MAG: hypothetical protein GXO48_02380 [Chlorobi bacterium]|nr:hypothetical protein [Chlorobiota bacterium]